jgi:hypothetical protein
MPTNRASAPGKQANRATALSAYQAFNKIVIPPAGHMGGLNARFSSFANTIQTRLNSSNGTTGGLGGTLEAQVDRALSQVLRQPGGGTGTEVATRPGDTSIASLVGGAGGVQPAMSPFQATLLREARITQADFLSILDSLQPLSPFTDPGDAACLQALVRAEVNGLLEEFAYTQLLPRQQRVRVFLGGLIGYNYDASGATSPIGQAPPGKQVPPGDIQALVNLFNLGGPLIPTISVEDQLASQQAVANDGALFDTQWNNFWSLALQNNGPFPSALRPSWSLWEWKSADIPPAVSSGLGNLLGQPHPGGGFNFIAFGPGSGPGQQPAIPQQANQAPWLIGVIDNPQAQNITAQSYAEKMIQADLLLPVIAQDASRVEDDLTAIGFTAGEQETTFALFSSAVDADLITTAVAVTLPSIPLGYQLRPKPTGSLPPGVATLPPGVTAMTPIPVIMTVADILDWAQSLAGPTSSDQLRQAGALGLNLICDQADELFWLVLAMLDPTATAQIPALGDSEVQLELSSLATDLNTLANLAY